MSDPCFCCRRLDRKFVPEANVTLPNPPRQRPKRSQAQQRRVQEEPFGSQCHQSEVTVKTLAGTCLGNAPDLWRCEPCQSHHPWSLFSHIQGHHCSNILYESIWHIQHRGLNERHFDCGSPGDLQKRSKGMAKTQHEILVSLGNMLVLF